MMESFIRIALARLRKQYPYYPERLAKASWMYRRWIDKNKSKNGDTDRETM
jgi:hypothetical protein